MIIAYGLVLVLSLCTLSANADELFEQQVAPIFKSHCVRCHNDKLRRGEFSLQSRAALKAGGESGEVVTAGDPDSSYLLDLITREDGKAEMPQGAPPLADADVETIRRWIAKGASWPSEVVIEQPQWWSLRPVHRPPSPDLPMARRDWTRNPIDAFIAAKHVEFGFESAAETDRRTWLRRVTFDLIGLPPSQGDIAEFLADDSPSAWEAAVDRLIASPAYGERWARHWLDVVRFSESDGFEEDAPRPHAWPYRDYVIRSLNADKPYSLFVREQLAGDVIEPVTHDGIEATGFLVAGPWDHAAAVAASEVERLRAREVMMDEMISVISQTFLGLTVNCARCHDHKFDPIPQTDYYAVKAVFEGVDQSEGNPRTASLVLTNEERSVFERREAELQASVAKEQQALQQIEEQIESLSDDKNLPPLNRAVAMWQFAANANESDQQSAIDLKGGQSNLAGKWTLRVDQTVDEPILALNSDQRIADTGAGTLLRNEAGGAGYAIIPNLAGSELFPRTQSSMTLFARVRFTKPFNGVDDIFRIGSSPSEHRDTIGLEFVADGDNQEAAHPQFVTLGSKQKTEQALNHKHSVSVNQWYDIAAVFESLPETGNGRMTLYLHDPNTGRQIGEAAEQEVAYDSLETGGVQNLLFFVAPSFRNGPQPGAQMDLAAVWHAALAATDVRALSSIEEPTLTSGLKDQQQRDELLGQLQTHVARLKERAAQAEAQLNQLRESTRKAFIGVRRKPPPTILFERGDVRQRGPSIGPAALSAIKSPELNLVGGDDPSDAARRSSFANWLTDADHPLTARVIVNRLWHYHFGRGLVDTPSDFGASGSLPTHPELLDWLADELVEHDWSLKHIHRLIVTSAIYRMQSSATSYQASGDEQAADPHSVDSDNRFLWRFPLRRLEAETVRDAMLAVSGELNRQMYGPSVQPFEVTRFNTYFYKLFDRDEPAYNRRTVYRMNVNTGRDPLLDALDCPAPSVMTPTRRETTTPLQALALMNDSFALRQAERLAQRVEAAASSLHDRRSAEQDVEGRIQLAWSIALGRTPEERELQLSQELIATSDFQTLCWALLNSSEFLYVQ
ncbi:MAG: PSD1 domain-containing protein [Planctomycetes bacterium]|nr:PSD1 domain-containing protein [Planctomycetota bacterium]